MKTSRQNDALVALRPAKEPPVLISVAKRKRNLDPPPKKRIKIDINRDEIFQKNGRYTHALFDHKSNGEILEE